MADLPNRNKAFTGFIKKLSILTLILAAAGIAAIPLLPFFLPAVLFYILGFFFTVTATMHYFLLKASERNPRRFPAYYMAGTSFKLFISLFFIVIYAVFNKEDAKLFLLIFFIIYLIYTAFETILLLKHLNPGKKDA